MIVAALYMATIFAQVIQVITQDFTASSKEQRSSYVCIPHCHHFENGQKWRNTLLDWNCDCWNSLISYSKQCTQNICALFSERLNVLSTCDTVPITGRAGTCAGHNPTLHDSPL